MKKASKIRHGISSFFQRIAFYFKSRKILCTVIVSLSLLLTALVLFQRNNDFDVDLVYLWCDGEEPAFAARKNEWLEKMEEKPSKKATNDGRFVQVDELKYSLRSVEKYLPWTHHIYIVTDRQVPKWLNTNHPKITIVDHSEIIPQKYIPVFNSNAIETSIHKIPGLSEHFLFANDDMFVNRPLDKSFFFDGGKPIVRLRKRKTKSSYQKMLEHTVSLIERDFGKGIPFFSDGNFHPHHNIDPYLKSDYEACVNHYDKEYTETLGHRFRKITSVQRIIVSAYSFLKGHAKIKDVSSTKTDKKIDSILLFVFQKSWEKKLSDNEPALFCINDNERGTPEGRVRLKEFLESYFPQKSKFEKVF